MTLEWWHWVVFGFVLIIAELAVPQFVLVWFGLGALLVGATMFVLSDGRVTGHINTEGLDASGVASRYQQLVRAA